jgi:hypothetical protein
LAERVELQTQQIQAAQQTNLWSHRSYTIRAKIQGLQLPKIADFRIYHNNFVSGSTQMRNTLQNENAIRKLYVSFLIAVDFAESVIVP